MGQRDRERRAPRRASRRNVRPRILIVCEGEKTEPQYFVGYRKHCENPLVDIEIARDRGSPKTLVGIAKAEKEKAGKLAKRYEDDNLRYEQVWCVFDVDEHEHIPEAIQMANDNGIEVAISNPCIELWLLLHFRESPGMQDRHKLQEMMCEFVEDYDKNIDFKDYAPGVSSAIIRASRMQAAIDESGDGWSRNPSTGVHRLAKEIAKN